ncbi:uncharacterized protein B0H64DRAFT_316793 [Chaetomium fimeti]|uniref:Uncharacterized protein n=1 Tax=Chaetomium fimeti TaxID=1854472 RepID=A0AAE0HND6_9PEZI|nr:hypothetical protein B0H64DRAFT_316793 [Chaetomium fimeti]
MPCLRGIEVFLTTKAEDEQIPEYPHPEGTSARLLGALSSCPNGQLSQPKAGPTVAVYIPSIPGTPFSINYSVNTAPAAPCKYIFFRLYMNARPIAAWGIDPAVRPKGKVVKSLWSPCRLYTDRVGFEGRNFVFLPGQEHKPVAEDGGLIEIQVFRAKARRARAPRLEEFRFQENYGIAAPSIGLLDQPQDACFYDWHLLDAKDSPFATFRLHYRSLQNLKRLNLIPATELELLCSVSPKVLRTIAQAHAASELFDNTSEEQSWLSGSGSADEAVFHDYRDRTEDLDAGDEREEETEFYFLKSPPERFPAASSNFRVPQPSKALRDAYLESYLQRPLPELPVDAPNRLSRRSSAASALSTTLSITPSLQQYAEEDSLDPEEVEVGVAQLVELPPSESTLSFVPDSEPNPADYSISDYDASPKSADDFFSAEKLSPGRYLPTTGSGLERGIALLTSPKRTIFSAGARSRKSLPSDLYSHRELSRLESTTSSESEWAVANPSPDRASLAENSARRKFSPQTIKKTGRSLLAGLRKNKTSGSPGKMASMVLGRDVPKTKGGADIVERVAGSRI